MGGPLGVGDGERADLSYEVTVHPPSRVAGEGGDAVGELDVIGKGVMHEQAHADRAFVDTDPKAFEEGVFVVEAAVNPAHGPVDAAFLVATGITVTWADCIAVKVIEQAATVAVVETCSGEVFAILDVGGATEPYFP